MAIVCPKCMTIHEQGLLCSVCGGQLPHRITIDPHRRSLGIAPLMQNPWGRLVIGLILAQGLFYALRHFFTGALLAAEGEQAGLWFSNPSQGFLLWMAMQAAALIVGGLLVGSSQRHALLLGFLLGVWSGVLSVLFRTVPAGSRLELLYGQPLIQGLIAALAAWIGSWIWRPIPSPVLPDTAKGPKVEVAVRGGPTFWEGPISWIRLLLGAAVIVAGSQAAPRIFKFIMEFAGGTLETDSYFHDRVVIWEIRILAILVGGVLAGANTFTGIKQGALAGLLSCGILLSMPSNQGSLTMATNTAVSTIFLGILGGWFGAHLLPPVMKMKRRKVAA